GKGTFGKTVTRTCAHCAGVGFRVVDAYTREDEENHPPRSHAERMGERTLRQINDELLQIASARAVLAGRETRDQITEMVERAERNRHAGSYTELVELIALYCYHEPHAYKLIMWVANRT